MYSVCLEKKEFENAEFGQLDGFLMGSRGRGFNIQGEVIRNINVTNKKLAHGVVCKKVFAKYDKLINLLTDILISDDDSDDTFREALNHIEKFRLEVKIKYREFLKKKELEKMSKQLELLKKEANRRMLEISDSYLNSKSSGKGR